MASKVKLSLQDTKEVGTLEITLHEITEEEIAAAPGTESSYPAGSGAVYHLKLRKDGKEGEATLSQLSPSPPYDGIKEATWEDNHFELIDSGDQEITINVS